MNNTQSKKECNTKDKTQCSTKKEAQCSTKKEAQSNTQSEAQKSSQSDYYWKCTVCGYEYESETLPKEYVCPVCGAFAPKFERRSHSEDNE